MITYDHLLNIPYKIGVNDCYSLVRCFYKDNFGIELTDYARPTNWEDSNLNLYMDNYFHEGFRTIDVHPRDYRVGDAFLMAINSSKANHAAVYIGAGEVIHHPRDLLSRKSPYAGVLRNTTVAVLRHKDVPDLTAEEHVVDISERIPFFWRRLQNAGGTSGS